MANYTVESIPCNGGTMDCIRFGTGSKNLVILPGISFRSMADSAASVAGAYRIFSEQFSIVLLDRKNPVPEHYSIEEMAADSAEVLRKLGIENACLFGASQGGAMAMFLTANHPELVAKVALVSTFQKPTAKSKVILQNWKTMAESGDSEGVQMQMFEDTFSPAFWEKNRRALSLFARMGTVEDCKRFAKLCGACTDFDATEALQKIHCPSLVIGAEHDRVCGVEASKEIAKILHCPLFIYEDYGHALYDEAPDFKQKLFDFFTP